MDEPLYYIQSQYGTIGNCVQWWAIGGHGYTCDLDKAWKLPKSKAQAHLNPGRYDKIWPCKEIDKLSRRHFDFQFFAEIKEDLK